MEISVSILGIKQNIAKKIESLNEVDVNYLHIDVMDGKFVSNKTDKFEIVRDNLTASQKKYDVHLMVEDVKSYVDKFKNLNPEYITFHYEVNDDLFGIINYIKANNIKVGISIKPSTDVGLILPYLSFVDLVLVMTVEPGLGGQKFMPEMREKIDDLKELRALNNLDFKIEVDGGINDETILSVKDVDMAVVGSYITSGNYKQKVKTLKETLQ